MLLSTLFCWVNAGIMLSECTVGGSIFNGCAWPEQNCCHLPVFRRNLPKTSLFIYSLHMPFFSPAQLCFDGVTVSCNILHLRLVVNICTAIFFIYVGRAWFLSNFQSLPHLLPTSTLFSNRPNSNNGRHEPTR